jgi:hypothetical protein
MIHTLLNVACAALVLWTAYKLGQASEVIRERDRMLDERAIPGAAGAGPGLESVTTPHPVSPPPRSSSIYDQEEARLKVVDS